MRESADKDFKGPSAFITRQSDHPLIAIVGSFSLGIALSLPCRLYSFLPIALADTALICAAFLSLRRDRAQLSLGLGLAAILTGGLLLGLAARDGFPESDLRNQISRHALRLGEPVSSDGCVVKESELRGEESVATVDLQAFLEKDRWIVCTGKATVRIPIQGPETPEIKLMRGDRVRGWTTWHVPRNFENPGAADTAGLLARRGIFLTGKIKSHRLLEIIPGGCMAPWTRIANTIGTRVQESLEPLRKTERGQQAAILASLVIGDYSGLSNPTREAFQNTGTFHVLVISGLHVAWIAGILLQALKWARIPERIRHMLVLMVLLLYTIVVGFQASISRCLWMFLLYLIGRMIFRQADAVNILLGAALILLLLQPCWLFDAGFQLSFLSVLAIAWTALPALHKYVNPACRPLLHIGEPDRLFLQPGPWHRLGRRLRIQCELCIEAVEDALSPLCARALRCAARFLAAAWLALVSVVVTSLAVQIWLQPLLACYFNRMSWISPFANIIVVPLSSLTLGSGAVAACAAHVPWLGPLLMRLAGYLAAFLLACTARIADLPGAWQRCPTPSAPWVLGSILLLSAWSFLGWRRFWAACAGVAVFLAFLACGSVPAFIPLLKDIHFPGSRKERPLWEQRASILSLTFLDVGEGDCIVVRFPDRRAWLLDAGGLRQPSAQTDSAYVFDIGEAVVSRYLWHDWINRIDRVLISHPDIDHAGGVAAIMRNFHIDGFGYARPDSDRMLSELLGLAEARHVPARLLCAHLQEHIGAVGIRVLNPPAEAPFKTTNENSLVLKISFKRFSALLTGDLEKAGETAVLSQPGALACQLLKVAHHGSRAGTSHWFLDRTKPRWAILSAGRNNPYGHPSKETMDRLIQHRVRPLSTVDEGAVTLETDGQRYLLKSHASGILESGEL